MLNSSRSFITELTLLLLMTLEGKSIPRINYRNYFDLDISFIAYKVLFFFCSTFQTLPKPPFPMTYLKSKACLLIPY